MEILETHELRARFESLVEGVFTVLAETRLFALFLDDLQDASDSYVPPICHAEGIRVNFLHRSLDLIRALINSRSRIVCIMTLLRFGEAHISQFSSSLPRFGQTSRTCHTRRIYFVLCQY